MVDKIGGIKLWSIKWHTEEKHTRNQEKQDDNKFLVRGKRVMAALPVK